MGVKDIRPPAPEARSCFPEASVKDSFPSFGSTRATTSPVETFTTPSSISTENRVFSFTGSTTRLFRSWKVPSGVADTRTSFGPMTCRRTCDGAPG